jgi:predicted nuclease of predicted toxin-antitoxin system
MKFLCDVHLPMRLVSFLNQYGINAIHRSTILSRWTTKDKDFCKYADDNDFRNSHFLQNTPFKLIKINLGNISNDKLISIFQNQLSKIGEVFKHSCAYVEISKDSISVLIR